MQITNIHDPFQNEPKPLWERGYWPANWISHPQADGLAPAITAFRKRFALPKKSLIRIYVTADERYELYLDGNRVGRGSERGDRENWFYETYEIDVDAGEHVFVAKTWWLGPNTPSPYAQVSVRPGFLLATDGEYEDILNTGVTEWECKILTGYSYIDPEWVFGTGAKVHIDGKNYCWGFENGSGEGWVKAVVVGRAGNASTVNEFPSIWMLTPSMLPPMLENYKKTGVARHVQSVSSEDTKNLAVDQKDNLAKEAEEWNALLAGDGSVTIAAGTSRRIIVDLANYYCAYPELVVSGGNGAKIRMLWAESLYLQPELGPKGNRDEIYGKYFIGMGDVFEPDGGKYRKFETLWWEAGRYLEFFIQTQSEPIKIESFGMRETHYPLDIQSRFESSDPRLAEVIPMAIRTLEMCAHETYMDCPYFEQLMYVGDTRLETLVTYITTNDTRLPEKALRMFDKSRRNSGITQSRYPCRVLQIIPPFSLWWAAMVHDYAMWRGDADLIAELMPGVQSMLDFFISRLNSDYLLESPVRWNFMDWVADWDTGIPPGGDSEISSIINWQLSWVLKQVAELEEYTGEPEMAARYMKLSGRVAEATDAAFWDEKRGIYADDLERQHFSEHAQCLALLGGNVPNVKRDRVVDGLLNADNLSRTSIYFTHYLFETYRMLGLIDHLFDRMDLWFGLKGLGFETTFEEPEPSRSDCHAWGSHPVYHYFASIMGIRPDGFGFKGVRIEPQLGSLEWARGSMPHPAGTIDMDLRKTVDGLSCVVSLPDGIGGSLCYGSETIKLHPGKNDIKVKN